MDLCPEFYEGVAYNYNAMWAYLVVNWRYESIKEIIRRRTRLHRLHRFSVSRFLLYCLGIKALAWTREAQHLFHRRSEARECPDNIVDFVEAVARGSLGS
jgi:hypothetical protein